jgi:hypothetical protein
LFLRRGDVKGILITVVFTILLFMGFIFFPTVNQKVNWLFGEEWDCHRMERGGPVCVKRDMFKEPQN